jgi:hypothetical protein
VSPDWDTFIELQNTDMQHCREFDKQLCRFHTGLNKRGSRKSCAIALFTEDKKQIQGTCQTEFMAWKGPEVAYLKKNRWAFSAIGPHDTTSRTNKHLFDHEQWSNPYFVKQHEKRATNEPSIRFYISTDHGYRYIILLFWGN